MIEGITERKLFILAAMRGLCANTLIVRGENFVPIEKIAKLSRAIAEATIRECAQEKT